MILVTFCPPSNEFYAECNIPGKYQLVIDLYNRTDKTEINVTTLNRRNFNEIEKWMTEARKNYLEFLGDLSKVQLKKNKTVRDFKLFNFPIYWLTTIAEKNPRNHWLFSYFLFLEFLKSDWYNDQILIIFLDAQTASLKDVIIELNSYYKTGRKIDFKILNKIKSINLFINIIKMHARLLIYRLPKKTSNIFDNQPIHIITNNKSRIIFSQFLEFSVTQKLPLAYKPLCISVINNQNINYISSQFWINKPSLFSQIEIFVKTLNLFYKIINLKEIIHINQIKLPIEVLKFEFYEVLKYSQLYFFKYLWYRNYFSGVQNKTLYFLEDEFYIAGRIISKAFKDANNNNIKLFGLQHGMFSYSHTVYAILQKEIEEIKTGDGIPIPYKFIVWGEFFKEIFNSNNKLGDEYIAVLGCPNFIKLKNSVKSYLSDNLNSEYILWCTTGEEQFEFEKNFVLKLVEIHKLPLVIRLHPGGHIYPKFVEEKLKNVNFQFDNKKDIYHSILKSQFVVTSAHSTVVLDCVVCNKPVYRIIFDRDDDVFKNEDKLIINIKYIEQIENLRHHENPNYVNSNYYLYLNDDRWQNFIKSELADNV